MIIEKAEIYKITYPNGKIYIGQDRTCDINYFGSACSFMVEVDFTEDQRKDFIVRKEILCTLVNKSIQHINRIEIYYIKYYKSNDPAIGYNRTGIARKRKKQIIIK